MPVVIHATTTLIAGLQELWAETFGESDVCVAVLDGLVDQSHSSFLGAKLTQLDPLVPNISNQGSAAQHATHVTSTYGRKFAYHYEQGTLLLSSWFCIRDSMEVNASCQL